MEKSKRPKRPRDPNQLAKLIVELSTGNTIRSKRLVRTKKRPQKKK